MNNNIKISKNPLDSTINDLKMFEQTQYCFEYIKEKNSNKTNQEIITHAEIASACFRQANEYYKAAASVSLSTSPLLYSYALNNILKGTCYLKTFQNDIISGFTSHGFMVKKEDVCDNILKSLIYIKEKGASSSLLKLFGNTIIPQKITFDKLLRHIPGICDVYFKSTGETSLLAIKDRNDNSKFIIEGNKISDDMKKIAEEFGLIVNVVPRNKTCVLHMNLKGKGNIDKDSGIYSTENVFYKKYLNIPDIFDGGIKDINIIFYCYLLIMSYGMLVRYNAHRWEEFIDKKESKNAILIELSVPNAVINFYYQIHYILFDYYYENDSYNDLDVKKVIRESTKDIMNNITMEIKHHNLQYNSHELLPWNEKYR